MKQILFIGLMFLCTTVKAQNEIDKYIETVIIESKNNYKIDPKDQTMKLLFDQFYNEVLQDEKGEISETLLNNISSTFENPDVKNMQILNLLLIFQDYINEISENPEIINPEFQLKIVEAMENEFISLNQDVPVLLYVYKIEALQSNEMFDASNEIIDIALKKFPNSIAIKSYKYLATSDVNIKTDLLKNHSNHWFVKQLELQ